MVSHSPLTPELKPLIQLSPSVWDWKAQTLQGITVCGREPDHSWPHLLQFYGTWQQNQWSVLGILHTGGQTLKPIRHFSSRCLN